MLINIMSINIHQLTYINNTGLTGLTGINIHELTYINITGLTGLT